MHLDNLALEFRNGGSIQITKTFTTVFNDFFPKIKFDKKFAKKLKENRLKWYTKNTDTIEFLNGNLLGVNPIRFSALDEDMYFKDIFDDPDVDALKNEIHSLDGVDPSFIVASNIYYLLNVYMMHRFVVDKHITDKVLLTDVIEELYYLTAYKMMSSLVTHYFKYSLSKEIALMVHEELNNKFLIKKKETNTWQKIFKKRAQDFTPPPPNDKLHWDKLKSPDAKQLTLMVADIQNRLRGYMKNIFKVIIDVKENDGKVISRTMSRTDIEGVDTLAELTESYDKNLNYLESYIGSKHDFIKDDILYFIKDELLSNLNISRVKDTLSFISDNYNNDKFKLKESLHSLHQSTAIFLQKKKLLSVNGEVMLFETIEKLKNFYGASKQSDVNILNVKKNISNAYVIATKRKAVTEKTTNVLGIMIYLILRSIRKY
jgi:hypothetical protein